MSRIAVIGSGIAGMSVAYLLSRKHEVWLYEREHRLGGHTHTHRVETSAGPRSIDTGFIVHNDRTYPNLVRLFHELGVERQKSEMSFGVSDTQSGMEYSSRGLGGFFATPSNLLRPAHYRLLRSILRFNRESTKLMQEGLPLEMTLGDYLRTYRFDADFARLYLYPMASAVWSTSFEEIDGFPASTLLQFFLNHGLLAVDNHPQWYAIKGGSSSYIEPLTRPYRDRIITSAAIKKVRGNERCSTVIFDDGREEIFDEVVFACRAPQALDLIDNPTLAELNILSCFKTSKNTAVLHTDERLLPRAKAARASWNYRLGEQKDATTVTYLMNRLQSLDTPEDYCVTLNDSGAIDPSKIICAATYDHPLFTVDAVQAQARWAEISGLRHLHFCGAYWFYGFHEDGFNSAIRVAKALGVDW